MKNYSVHPIEYEDTKSWLKHRHYAKRMPPVSFAFGLYCNSDLIGVVTYGVPSSAPLRVGIAGDSYKNHILELNRLCLLHNKKNQASFFIATSIKFLPRNNILVSYADTEQGHVGYIYQAANWLYTGLSAKRTDWKVDGIDLHGQTIADKSRGQKKRVEYMREKYKDAFHLENRPRKHRYIYFIGTKRQKKEMLAALRYPILPYPKGDTKRYEVPETQERQLALFT